MNVESRAQNRSDINRGISRRDFLKLAAAGLLVGCSPSVIIEPFVAPAAAAEIPGPTQTAEALVRAADQSTTTTTVKPSPTATATIPPATENPEATSIATVEPSPTATEKPITIPTKAEVKGPTYTVRKGDTLYNIAERNDCTMEELAALNGITDFDVIYAGQELFFPAEDVSQVGITDIALEGVGIYPPHEACSGAEWCPGWLKDLSPSTSRGMTYVVETGDGSLQWRSKESDNVIAVWSDEDGQWYPPLDPDRRP